MQPLPLAPSGARPPASGAASALDTARLVGTGQRFARQVADDALRAIAETHQALNAVVRIDRAGALRDADAVDRARAAGQSTGPLGGVPYVVKDNIDVRGQVTSSGSRAHEGAVAPRDATAVSRLRAAGAVLLGRANMDELALGASTHTSAFGYTRNPWDARRSPGGSSGGSAAAVAAGLVPFALGTDTGGSIREPAAQCGVVGFAPTPELVSVQGVVPSAPALDRVGPLTRTVADAALVLAVLTGRPDLAELAGLTDRGSETTPPRLRVGVVAELCGAGNQAGVLSRFGVALDVFDALHVELVPVSVPDAASALPTYMAITSAEVTPLLEHYIGRGVAGTEVHRRYEIGQRLLADGNPALVEAYAAQDRLVTHTRAALSRCDVLVSPTMPTTAPLLFDEAKGVAGFSDAALADPLLAPYTDCWTVVANLAGLPALSMPIGRSPDDGMPVGLMLTGAPGSDASLLGLAAALEATGIDR